MDAGIMNTKKITIAVDGFSSCGKSTLAKALAKRIQYTFIDSGAMYRCVALYAIRNGLVHPGQEIDQSELISALPDIHIEFGAPDEQGNRNTLLNGENVSSEIRSIEVAQIVSEIATIKEVRHFLVQTQQKLGANGGVIMDGRDIGSVVFPNAELKLFVTASTEIRAQRRYLELKQKDPAITLEAIRENLAHRDHLDTTREESPLIQTADAIVLDNTNLTESEQLELAYQHYLHAANN